MALPADFLSRASRKVALFIDSTGSFSFAEGVDDAVEWSVAPVFVFCEGGEVDGGDADEDEDGSF